MHSGPPAFILSEHPGGSPDPGVTNYSFRLYSYGTGETLNGSWIEHKSDLGVLKK